MPIKNLLKGKRKLNKILSNWSIYDYRSVDLISSYGGDVILIILDPKRKYILKDKAHIKNIEHEYLLLSQLREMGIPVSMPILTADNKCHVSCDKEYYWLYPYMPGKIIENHYATGYLNRAESFGEAIGKLHIALNKVKVASQFPYVNLYSQICGPVAQNLTANIKHFDKNLINEALDDIRRNFSRLYRKLPIQLIHRDLHPSNMIFKNSEIAGYINFEIAQRNARIFDVCYCATSILVGGFKHTHNREKWLSIFESLLRGYSKYINVTQEEKSSLFYILSAIQLLFMSYCIVKNLKASLFNAKILKWIISNRSKIESIFN